MLPLPGVDREAEIAWLTENHIDHLDFARPEANCGPLSLFQAACLRLGRLATEGRNVGPVMSIVESEQYVLGNDWVPFVELNTMSGESVTVATDIDRYR